ncbi:fungal-specific transcription factor domain-containing protein [Penicillium malachiteum]|uniref:fungal-specific transcription factor domain-containing protein n=1 Tax=Penicillium malachiteum TaxID=1324776 RepID=UPI00254984AF|nr:fungal-specific transcription factor domain-containing protein [Penicillium malachiteum]KAJ5730743.1 fungal-specific transcription factor domain-containing protein [Penicillium malachiteum]
MLYGSEEDEHERPTIHQAFDTMFDNNDGFPFMVGGSTSRITHLHPSTIQIFQLWQVYLNNVNPLLKIGHAPTLQNQIVEAGANLSHIGKPLEALMFSIYLIAISSMMNDGVQTTFGTSKSVLLARYHEASQSALINAGFMRSCDLMTLQAYLLYLLSAGRYMDPRSFFCLIGIAIRVATRIGLHRDGAQFGLSPFETEQRRRLWWQLALLDKRIAEMTGSAITALSSSRADCRLPLNVNDTDLYKHTKEPPISSSCVTEMLFCLTRIELLVAVAPSGARPEPSIVRNMHNSNSDTSVPPSTSAERSKKPSSFHALEDYCAYIETKYLKHCDTKIPIQHFTLMMGRVSLYKLRVVDFICRRIPASEIPDKEREALFLIAVQMIECDDEIYTIESLRGFLWYTHYQAPMPGFIFLISELRHRTTGSLCERAWKAICSNHHNRGMIRKVTSPMHAAFGQAMLKAWNAREQAELKHGKTVEPPELIHLLRRVYSSKGMASQQQTGFTETSEAQLENSSLSMSTAVADVERETASSDMMFDGSMMFPPLDGMGEMDGSRMMEYGETDWSYIMSSEALCGLFDNFTEKQ